ncbi:MAG: LbtU family siderophore porin [Desulfobacteraceae bacterium]|jgi:hypothetical protein
MKKVLFPLAWLLLAGIFVVNPAMCLETGKDVQTAPSSEGKSLEDRIQKIEESMNLKKEASWFENVKISGAVEVEEGYSNTDLDDPAGQDEKTGDVDLSAVEVAIDAVIAPQVDAHVLFKYEDDDVFLDEGYITLKGPEGCPASLTAGRLYIPFGTFESSFISDPLTLELGETNEGAVVVGCRLLDEKVNLDLGIYNGKTEERGEDDTLSNYVARVTVAPMEGISFGASYTSNFASTDAFSEQVQDDLDQYVAGWSVFVSATLMDKLTVNAEYLAAIDKFKAGEIYDAADTTDRSPEAWNIEVGYAFMDNLNAALRYGGSNDGDAEHGEFLAETQFGAVMNWDMFNKTSLALEYMNSSYAGDYQTVDTVSVQLTVEF